jgi:hypothetical protein
VLWVHEVVGSNPTAPTAGLRLGSWRAWDVGARGYPHLPMRVHSELSDLSADHVRAALAGLPPAAGYRVVVKPLRYRERPHLSAWTSFEEREIVLQVPQPFFAFGEIVPYGARRRPGKGLRFIWLTEGVTFTTRRQVLRFLYLHEWMHWYLRERLGKRSQAETACDRFALRNYRRRTVRVADAELALRRSDRAASAAAVPIARRRRSTN